MFLVLCNREGYHGGGRLWWKRVCSYIPAQKANLEESRVNISTVMMNIVNLTGSRVTSETDLRRYSGEFMDWAHWGGKAYSKGRRHLTVGWGAELHEKEKARGAPHWSLCLLSMDESDQTPRAVPFKRVHIKPSLPKVLCSGVLSQQWGRQTMCPSRMFPLIV